VITFGELQYNTTCFDCSSLYVNFLGKLEFNLRHRTMVNRLVY